MKIDRTRPTNSTGAIRPARAASGPQTSAPVAPARGIEDSILVMGIPEGELTPRVRDAISKLLGEVVALKQEVETNRRRICLRMRPPPAEPLSLPLQKRAHKPHG